MQAKSNQLWVDADITGGKKGMVIKNRSRLISAHITDYVTAKCTFTNYAGKHLKSNLKPSLTLMHAFRDFDY